MIYLRHVAMTAGPATPASVATLTADVAWLRRQVEAELDQLFPGVHHQPLASASLVVVAAPGADLVPLARQAAAGCQPTARLWLYATDRGRVEAVDPGQVQAWERRTAAVARVAGWAAAHPARWSLVGRAAALIR